LYKSAFGVAAVEVVRVDLPRLEIEAAALAEVVVPEFVILSLPLV